MFTEWKWLSEQEQKAWLESGEPNGCGAKGTIFGIKFVPPYSILFEASCNIHDYNYKNGGDKKDRKKADLGLLKYMCSDVRRLPVYKQPYYYIWCIIYYLAVRLFGGQYFNYIFY